MTSKLPNFSTARWDSRAYSAPDSASLGSWSDSTHTLDTSLSGAPPPCIHQPPPPFCTHPINVPSHCENFDVWILTSSTRFINPHNIPCNNIHPNLVPQSALPLHMNEEKGFPGMTGPCCGMRTSVPYTLMRQVFRLPLSFLLLKTIFRKIGEYNSKDIIKNRMILSLPPQSQDWQRNK